MPQFDSGAAKQIGRFSEGLLLRLLHLDTRPLAALGAAGLRDRGALGVSRWITDINDDQNLYTIQKLYAIQNICQ